MKKILIILMFMILIPIFGGCKRKAPNEIVVSEVAHSVFYAPQYVALSKGFFEEEGLKVTIINSNGADKVMAALLSGEVQIGLAGAEACVYVYNQGQTNHGVLFAQLTQKDGSFLVGREEITNFDYSMLSGSEIIGGRRGGMPEMVLEYALKQNGLEVGRDDPTKEVNVRTDYQFAAMAGAFASGIGDYVTVFEPTGTILEKEGKGHVLASLGEETGNIPYTDYFVLKDYLQENEEIVQKFTNAIYKGTQWCYSHTAAEIAEACITYFPDSTLTDLTKVMQRYMDIEAWARTPVLHKDAYEHLLEIMDEAGELTATPPYEELITTKFAEETIKE